MLPFLTQGSRFYSTYASALSKSRNKAGVLLDLLFIFPMLLDRAAFCGCQKVGLSRDITSDCRSEVTRLGGLHEFLSVSKSFSGCPKPWFVIIFAFFVRTCGVSTRRRKAPTCGVSVEVGRQIARIVSRYLPNSVFQILKTKKLIKNGLKLLLCSIDGVMFVLFVIVSCRFCHFYICCIFVYYQQSALQSGLSLSTSQSYSSMSSSS